MGATPARRPPPAPRGAPPMAGSWVANPTIDDAGGGRASWVTCDVRDHLHLASHVRFVVPGVWV